MLSLTNTKGSLYVGNMPTTQIYDINLSDYSSDLTTPNGKGYINISLPKNTINYITNDLDINHYSPLLAGLNGSVNALTKDASGNLYAGGTFTSTVGGAPNTLNYIAKWDGLAWSPLGFGLNGTVNALTMDAGGNLIAGGSFTSTWSAGTTIATLKYIAKWDGLAWSNLGAGLNGFVNALTKDASGKLFAGGQFTADGNVVTSLNRIAKWDGLTWSPLGFGLNGTVNALTMDATGNLYAGGSFTSTVGGAANSLNRIAKWAGLAWSPLGSGLNNTVNALTMNGGNLYAGGQFTTTSNGVTSLNYIAKWDGTTSSWSALGVGLNSTVSALTKDASGNLYAGGQFWATSNNVTVLNRIAKWDGLAWSPLGSGLNSNVNALTMDASGNPIAGGQFSAGVGNVISLNYVCKIILTPLNIFIVDISVNSKFLNNLYKSQTLSANVTNNSICYSQKM